MTLRLPVIRRDATSDVVEGEICKFVEMWTVLIMPPIAKESWLAVNPMRVQVRM
jgi:hypothetical protein